MSYAEKTNVPIGRSQDEIRKIISKHGANGFVFGEQGTVAVIGFELKGKRIKFILPMPELPSKSATQASIKTYEQLCRSKWRVLVLTIKAKLEAVENGVTTLEQEFMAHIVLPNGETVGQFMIPQIESAYKNGKMPPLLEYTE